MPDTQRNICCTCKFWNPWRVVVLADDEARALGHCVVKRYLGENIVQSIVQGLTAEDFYCGQHQPIHSKQERADGNV